MDHIKIALELTHSAYEDYISGRFLLINSYPINGVILGSMAIEKYLKAILVIILQRPLGKKEKIHFDKFVEIVGLFNQTDYKDIFNIIDKRFIELMTDTYKLRYFDNVKQPATIGFVVNQVIAELDLFVGHLDRLITIDTQYKRAVNDKNGRVFDFNWGLNGWDKKEFCERECLFYGISVDPEEFGPIIIENYKLSTPYNGRLTKLSLNKI